MDSFVASGPATHSVLVQIKLSKIEAGAKYELCGNGDYAGSERN